MRPMPGDTQQRWICLVLAAGKGTRMRSDLAKVLHRIDGRTLLSHVLDTAGYLGLARTMIVVGHQAEEVRRSHALGAVEAVLQEPQLGTGHAVMVAEPLLLEEPDETNLLVLYGDVPLLRPTTLLELMERHLLEENAATVLTAEVSDPTGYGRVIRQDDGAFRGIVEDRDLRPDQRSIREINSGIYTFKLKLLRGVLGRLKADNSQKEYYLTDALGLLRQDGCRVGISLLKDPEEISGINTREQLAEAGAVLLRRGGDRTGCPICEAVRGRADDLLLERSEGIVVLLKPRPYNSGQLLIAPERHVISQVSLSDDEAERLWRTGRRAEAWLEEAYSPQAFNLGLNSGGDCGHLALQVIPRWTGDSSFLPLVAGINILPESLEDSRRQILQARARAEKRLP